MIKDLKKEIVQILSQNLNTVSITFVGSVESVAIEQASDIDIVVICKKLTKEYYFSQIDKISNLNENLYKPKFNNLYINHTFGPLKFNKKSTLVLHLMIYDLKTHKDHVIESPFTCLDWILYDSSYGKSLNEIYPVFNLQIDDFISSRRSISDYIVEFNARSLSYRKYIFETNTKFKIIKKYKKVQNIDLIEFMHHIIKFSLINLCKFKVRKNKIFNANEIFQLLPEFLQFKYLLNITDRKKNNINNLNVNKLIAEFEIFLDFLNQYLNKLENKLSKKTFYFVRHSKTNLNDGTFLGIGRNPSVAKKINKLKLKEIHSKNLKYFYSSPLKRATETANQISDKFIINKNLIEINYGLAEGLTMSELKIQFPGTFLKLEKGIDVNFPNGENISEVKSRIFQFLKECSKTTPFLAVTHQVIIRILICLATGYPITSSYKFSILHEIPYEFNIFKGKVWSRVPRKEIYNLYQDD